MAVKSYYLERAIINFGTGHLASFDSDLPRPWEIGLLTTNPDDDSPTGLAAAVECADANYSRVNMDTTTFGTMATVPTQTNTIDIVFGTAAGFATAQTITGIAVYTSTGFIVLWQTFAITAAAGQRVIIPAGQFVWSED